MVTRVLNEAELRKYLIKNVDDSGHFCPIEAHASQPGVPDYSYTVDGVNGWLELKHGTLKMPPNLRSMQKVWMDRNVNYGGEPLILCSIVDNVGMLYGIIHGSKTDGIYMAKHTSAWVSNFSTVWSNEIVWPEFLAILRNPRSQR